MQKNINNVEVPVTDSDGNIILEPLNQGGKQSDGSMWYRPTPLIPEGHEHYFKLQDPSQREAWCECGFGGAIYPHNATIKDGHIYSLTGEKII